MPLVLFLVAAWLLAAWAAAKALIVNSQLAHADAIVVLAGSSTYLERTHAAAKLFRDGRAPLIVLTNDNIRSGWSAEQERNPLFVERAADELKRNHVDATKIEIIPGAVAGTHDEVLHVREYANIRGWHSIIVVTSAYQSRRALWTLQRVFAGTGIAVGIEPVAPGEQSPTPGSWWWHRLGWKLVALEYIKIAYYRWNY